MTATDTARRCISSDDSAFFSRLVHLAVIGALVIGAVVMLFTKPILGVLMSFCALFVGAVLGSMVHGLRHVEMDDKNLYVSRKGAVEAVPLTDIAQVGEMILNSGSIVDVTVKDERGVVRTIKFMTSCEGQEWMKSHPIVAELEHLIDAPAAGPVTSRVVITLPEDRAARCSGKRIQLNTSSVFAGELTLELSDGPFGIREYDNPNYLKAQFDFEYDGRKYRYTDWITQGDLWLPSGNRTLSDVADFEDQVGQMDGLIDDREDWSYVKPDGSTHTNRLKYTGCHFQVMIKESELMVRCEYYDQNPGITAMVPIYYSRPLSELLILKETRYYYDADGNLEDFESHYGDDIVLTPL